MAPYTNVWAVSFGDKKKLYGKGRVPTGGKNDNNNKDDDDDKSDDLDQQDEGEVPTALVADANDKGVRSDKIIEPVSYNSKPVEFCQELVHSLCLKEVYDLSPCDGCFAQAMFMERRSYVGVCFTDAHKELLHEHLCKWFLSCMADSTHQFYQPNYKKRKTEAAGAAAGANPPAGEKRAKVSKKEK